MRLEARAEASIGLTLLAFAAAAAAVITITAGLIAAAGAPITRAFASMAGGAFGSIFAM
ncbi:MAG: ABC transporter permease, partial [Alphaproteobacteria bacterium]|nr:ABC transporter permease [Alphaproteobacteria bacterium]